jgi:serine/threonine protein kinase
MLPNGYILDGFIIEDEIGKGSFGWVFRAKNSKTGDLKAIKLSNARSAIDKKRFLGENAILFKLSPHPRILTPFSKVIDKGGVPEIVYYVMELGDCDLSVYINRTQLTDAEKLKAFVEICEGIKYAHTQSVVHRDLHQNNILVINRNGSVEFRVNDFGRAKDFTVADLSTSPCWGFYVSPPEFLFRAWGNPTLKDFIFGDIYALGIILYSLFSTPPLLQVTSLFSNINNFLQQSGIKDIDKIAPKKRAIIYDNWIKTKAPRGLFELTLTDYKLQTNLNRIIEKLCDMDFNNRYKDIDSIINDISSL